MTMKMLIDNFFTTQVSIELEDAVAKKHNVCGCAIIIPESLAYPPTIKSRREFAALSVIANLKDALIQKNIHLNEEFAKNLTFTISFIDPEAINRVNIKGLDELDAELKKRSRIAPNEQLLRPLQKKRFQEGVSTVFSERIEYSVDSTASEPVVFEPFVSSLPERRAAPLTAPQYQYRAPPSGSWCCFC